MSQETVKDKWMEYAVNKERQEISEGGREMAQYIRDLYNSGAKLWTKEIFRSVEADLGREPRPQDIVVRSMNGVLSRKQIPLEDEETISLPRVNLDFKIYQSLVYDAESENFKRDIDCSREPEISEHRALATCALDLVVTTGRIQLSIEYLQLKAAWDEARCKITYIPPNIKRIVCFGLGSLEGCQDYPYLDALSACDGLPLRREMTQHAAALTIATVLGERLGTNSLPILAQDPAYSSLAKRLLMSVGFEVVGGHGSLAFTHVDEETVVVSCYPDIPVKQVVADIARPAVMIWNEVEPAAKEKIQWMYRMEQGTEIRLSPWNTDQDSPRTRQMIEGFDQFDFPVEPERFGNLKIYVRKD